MFWFPAFVWHLKDDDIASHSNLRETAGADDGGATGTASSHEIGHNGHAIGGDETRLSLVLSKVKDVILHHGLKEQLAIEIVGRVAWTILNLWFVKIIKLLFKHPAICKTIFFVLALDILCWNWKDQ